MSSIEHLPDDEGIVDRGLGAWDRLGPLSAGAVAASLLAVGVGRLLGLLVGRGARRSFGWSAVGALVPLALWLLTASDDDRREAAGQGADDSEDDKRGKESVDG